MKSPQAPLLSNNPRRKSGKTAFFLRWSILAIIAGITSLLWIRLYAVTPGPLQEENGVIVYVPPDTGFKGIETILISQGVIEPDPRFPIIARFMGVSKKLKAGEYQFTAGQTPYQVLKELESGSTLQRPLTIPEGANIYQIADIIAKQGCGSKERFLALVKEPQFIEGFGFNFDSLEGYLFPDTYNCSRGQDEKNIIKAMVGRFKEVFSEIGSQRAEGAPSLSAHEIVTLASIVEKETAVAEERPLIARVFLNRLKRGMRLQSDPTVIYGLANFDGNLTRRDLKEATPYNTYVIKGLPPGPIGNPGREAIEAVLNPADEKYLYFVSKNDGTHHFSKTLKDHNRAVVKYQKKRNSH